MNRAHNLCTHIFKVDWMAQKAGEGHGDDAHCDVWFFCAIQIQILLLTNLLTYLLTYLWGDDIINWTRKTLADCTTVARDRRNCRELGPDFQKIL